jgi:quercetin dioxygenase-like cupin family protein
LEKDSGEIMKITIRKLSELKAQEVSGHQGFVERPLVKIADKGVTVRALEISPGGVGPVPAHTHPERHCFLVLEGVLELEVEGKRHRIPSGSFAEVPPQVTHQLRCSGNETLKVLAIKWR